MFFFLIYIVYRSSWINVIVDVNIDDFLISIMPTLYWITSLFLITRYIRSQRNLRNLCELQSTIVYVLLFTKDAVRTWFVVHQTKKEKHAEKEIQRHHRVSKLTNLRNLYIHIIRERKPKQLIDKSFIYGSDDEPWSSPFLYALLSVLFSLCVVKRFPANFDRISIARGRNIIVVGYGRSRSIVSPPYPPAIPATFEIPHLFVVHSQLS